MTASPLRVAAFGARPAHPLSGRPTVPTACGAVVVALGVAVLVGWVADVMVLTTVVPGLVAMRPITALCLVAIGMLLLLARTAGRSSAVPDRWWRVLGFALALVVVGTGFASLLQELSGTSWGYETAFGLDRGDTTADAPGRPPMATAVCLILLASAFLAMLVDRVGLAQWFALAGMVAGLLATLVYAFGVDEVYRITDFTSMAVHTSVAVLLAGFGILHLRPDRGFMPLAVSEGPGGAVVRRVLPLMVVVPTLVGLASQIGVERGWFGPRFAMAATLGAVCVGGGVLVWRQAAILERTGDRLVDAESTLERIRRAEADREQAVQRLQVANADLERFAAIAAHDLRAPLTTIRGYAELLGDRAEVSEDPHALDLARRIERLVGRGTELIDDLLTYSRSGLDSQTLVPTPLAPLAEQVAREVQETAGRPTTIEVGELGTVAGDLVQLRQLLHNLVGNAVKYCPADRDPVVCVDALPAAGGKVQVRVSDNGPGIPAEERHQVFAIFQRGSRTADVAGSGVGLAICERIVGRHGGTIWVEEGPDGGARFCFTLTSAD
ncbi:sensor histidine kinase [Nocardioides coralli]|uniref:sensor histidine kinase n=1 Tax=Nocardioides coralli TaxID=2872154 RepID=UPI001CA43A11|nr:HAMP domain-containing sensor histidine kinase [Nocardioides coralli]QZY29903.1 HAMP domain-containing histidine kinase [Nocardioides coralli]